MQLTDAVAIISGGASGLGWASASALASAGARVVLLDVNSTVGEIADTLPTASVGLQVDITDEKRVASAVEEAATLGDIRVNVNCAGITVAERTVSSRGPHGLDDYLRVVNVNLVGTFNVCRLVAAKMAANEPYADGQRGLLVNTASIAAYDGQVGQLAYAASKGGIVGMTLPMARDLARYQIRAMTIAPGVFDTPMLGSVPQEVHRQLEDGIPHPSRLGQPEEYAQLVMSIVGNPYLNGEVIRLDGALRMAPQ